MRFSLKKFIVVLASLGVLAGAINWIYQSGYPSNDERRALEPLINRNDVCLMVVPHDTLGTPRYIIVITNHPQLNELLASIRPSLENLRRFRLELYGQSLTRSGLEEIVNLSGLKELRLPEGEVGLTESDIAWFKNNATQVTIVEGSHFGLPYPIPDDLPDEPID